MLAVGSFIRLIRSSYIPFRFAALHSFLPTSPPSFHQPQHHAASSAPSLRSTPPARRSIPLIGCRTSRTMQFYHSKLKLLPTALASTRTLHSTQPHSVPLRFVANLTFPAAQSFGTVRFPQLTKPHHPATPFRLKHP